MRFFGELPADGNPFCGARIFSGARNTEKRLSALSGTGRSSELHCRLIFTEVRKAWKPEFHQS